MDRRRARAFIGVALLLGGCRLFVSLDDLTGGPAVEDGGNEAANDVGQSDAAVDTNSGDTTSDVAIDGGPDVRDARGTSDRAVSCQSSPTCPLSHQACCIVYDNAADYCYDAAVPGDCVFDASVVIRRVCDDDKDCADLGLGGTVCCGSTVNGDGTGGYTNIECVAPAACTGNNKVRLCDSVEKECPGGGTCVASSNAASSFECH